jgi:hypothetical protein
MAIEAKDANVPRTTVRDLLLARRGLAFLDTREAGRASANADDLVRAFEIELADLGYVLSTRLRARLLATSLDELRSFRVWAHAVLAGHLGANRKHEPLFRRFPDGIPNDTRELWWRKVLVHFLQAEAQPCSFCRRAGTTHVLDPCRHVVCDHCFDGASYSACPVCEHHVDRNSPFFLPAAVRGAPKEKVTFELLDLGHDVDEEARVLFLALCARAQALSPDDRNALAVVVREYGRRVLPWVPAEIPVRENVAIVFGTLFQTCDPDEVLPIARTFMTTATDVLRFLAVYSGADGSLQRETRLATIERSAPAARWWSKIAAFLGASPAQPAPLTLHVPIRVNRFKVARLRRPLRRALLAVLEGLHPERLAEDMLRHRSYWVWVGEFLHPHEYAARFPNVARAFAIVRGKAPDGTEAPPFQTFYGKLEAAVTAKDTTAMLALLGDRPGELARRLDHVLRIAGDDVDPVIGAFVDRIRSLTTPVLLTLRSHLPTRTEKAPIRVYWPKGAVAKGVSDTDSRAPLSPRAITPVLGAIDEELLRRFGEKAQFEDAIVDDALRTILVPFNERTASPAAVNLPRGSRVPIAPGKVVRMFLHWCQPEKGGSQTDIDLSVGFYDEKWQYVGVCSFHELVWKGTRGVEIAKSAGDLRDAPFPDGASEFVDLHRQRAIEDGIRYAVMVVNNYAGMPFSQLERGFAGLMLRDDIGGKHFDPRTVELKFALTGENGIFMPLVFDLRDETMHWLDVQAKGGLGFNTVATSNSAITKICPELMTYFGSGVRPSMFDLALLHAAARSRRVIVRGETTRWFLRSEGESVSRFHARLVANEADEPRARMPRLEKAALAALFRGGVDLPPGSEVYALFRDDVVPTLSASDFLS